MKIDVKAAKVTSNIPKDNTTRMAIDADGMEHIMSLLTNLYKDPETAVIREYYTNAVDAHIEAGVTKAVKVKLPTWDDPVYTVQDFGVGMSEWDIKNVYSQYGASTKRNSNTQAGAFGLGCKSAFAIANQFTVVSVKNGMKCTTLFSMVVNGTYESTVVSNVPTTEGNGTIVKVPVDSAPYNFNAKAKKFFQFSKPGLVVVDGQEPVYVLDQAQKLENPNDADMLIHLRVKADGESSVIMGNTPYALSQTEIEASLARLGVTGSRGFIRMPKYFTVGIGDVDLTPSREGLMFTEKTCKAVDAHISFIVNDLREIAIKDLDAQTTLSGFFMAHKRWNDVVTVPRSYKGTAVPTEIHLDSPVRTISRTTYGSASHSESPWFRLDRIEKSIIVKGYSADNYKKLNGYLTPYMNAKGMSDANFLVTDSKDIHTNVWLKMSDAFTIVDGADIIEIGREQRKLDRQAASKANGTAKRPKIHYPVLFVDEEEVRWVAHDEIAQDTPYLHSVKLRGEAGDFIKFIYKYNGHTRTVDTDITKYFETVTDAKEIILMGGSRTIKALEQRIKETRSLLPDIGDSLKDVKALITDDIIDYHAVSQSSWKRFLKNTGIDRTITEVKDPDIIKIISPAKATVEAYKLLEYRRGAMKYFMYENMPLIPSIELRNGAVNALDRKYPLIDSLNTWTLKRPAVTHIIKYFNLIHEEQTKASGIYGNKISV